MLPTYAFERTRFWPELGKAINGRLLLPDQFQCDSLVDFNKFETKSDCPPKFGVVEVEEAFTVR